MRCGTTTCSHWRKLPNRLNRPPIWYRGCGISFGALIAEHSRRGVGHRYVGSMYYAGNHRVVGWFPELQNAKQLMDRALRKACLSSMEEIE